MPQADPTRQVIIVGGGSRAGRALAAALPPGNAIPIVRAPLGLPGEQVVKSYTEVPPDLDLAGAAIVNCAGTPVGDADSLARANVDIPLAWASHAAAENAARFIQISSFSVYGPASWINQGTPPAPVSDYGRSKLAAELALRETGLGTRLTILRVPILIGGGADKLARLVALVRRTGVVPTAHQPCPRSMLSYGGLAATMAGLIRDNRGGTFIAADPDPFTPQMLERAAHAAGSRARVVKVPGLALALVRRAAPGLHASLFEPNVLDKQANVAGDYLPFERIPAVLARLLAA